MDGAPPCWYFSTMPSRAAAVPRVDFHRTKYGRELLVDARFLRRLAGFDFSARPYALDFHEILLVTRGRGHVELDGRVYPVAPGAVLVTRPGEVRSLRVPRLDGACLFFETEFVREAFADPFFLDRFAALRADRRSPVLWLTPAENRGYLTRFRAMEREIASLRDDVSHALRAQLYELLVDLDRRYLARHGVARQDDPGDRVAAFRRLLERDIGGQGNQGSQGSQGNQRRGGRRHRVADYARELGITPGHLSALCRRQLGRSAGACLRERLRLEAKRLLLYTELGAAEVGYRLGFEDPAYFARFFRREVGEAPGQYRRRRLTRPPSELPFPDQTEPLPRSRPV